MNKFSNAPGGYSYQPQRIVDLNDGMDMDEYGVEYYDEEDIGNSGGSGDTEELMAQQRLIQQQQFAQAQTAAAFA